MDLARRCAHTFVALALLTTLAAQGCRRRSQDDATAPPVSGEAISTDARPLSRTPDLGADVDASGDTVPESARTATIPIPISIKLPAEVDEAHRQFIARWKVPGMAVAVSYQGRLIFARGYGLADVEAGEAVQPRSRFRVASLSKPVTAVAVMHLAERGLIDLDAPAFTYLESLTPPPGSRPDPRIDRITVRDLLRHTSGWSFREYRSGDPLTEVPESIRQVATAMGVPSPANPTTLVRYLRGRVPLARAPGTAFGYTNMNYVVLARIVEAVTGRGYEEYVRQSVLRPMGIRSMAVGETARERRLDHEVTYYDAPGARPTTSVLDGVSGPVSWPYGGWDLRAMDGAGGWVADVVDYTRFLLSFDGRPEPPNLISPESVAAMTARPPHRRTGTSWYGLGLSVRQVEGGLVVTHSGGLQGTSTVFARYPDGYTVVMFLNSHPSYPSTSGSGYSLRSHLDETIGVFRRLAPTLPGLTDQDLFPLYEHDTSSPSTSTSASPLPTPRPITWRTSASRSRSSTTARLLVGSRSGRSLSFTAHR